jgi:hypothetical protein
MSELSQPKIAMLGKEQVEKVRKLEEELGDVYVVAYEKPLRPAKLTDEQLAKLQAAEKEMEGVYLVVYEK